MNAWETYSVHIGPAGQQTIDYTEVGAFDGVRYRVCIHCDSIACQGRACVEVFEQSARRWNEIYSIAGECMKTRASYKQMAGAYDFALDRTELLRHLKFILSSDKAITARSVVADSGSKS